MVSQLILTNLSFSKDTFNCHSYKPYKLSRSREQWTSLRSNKNYQRRKFGRP